MPINDPNATIGMRRPKNASIGAPKGRDIFASHWADVNGGDPSLPKVKDPTLAQTEAYDPKKVLQLAMQIAAGLGNMPGQDPMLALAKASSIGAPKQPNIFQSHFADVDGDPLNEPDKDGDELASLIAGVKRPNLPTNSLAAPVGDGQVQGNGLPIIPKALLQAIQMKPSIAGLPDGGNGIGDIQDRMPEEDALPGADKPQIPSLSSNPVPGKKGNRAGALMKAILGAIKR